MDENALPPIDDETIKKPNFRWIPIDELKPYPNNPRRHGDDDIALLTFSLRYYGWGNGVQIQKGTNLIIAGHGRIEAAKRIGLKKAPCLELDLNEPDSRGYRIMDNKSQEMSSWDDAATNRELVELDGSGFDVAFTGFSDLELGERIEGWGAGTGLTDPDAVPETPQVAKTKPGDLYVLGDHRLLCGDSLELANIEMLMGGKKADMVFTDPPYNIDYGNIKHPKFKVRSIENDSMSQTDWKEFCAGIASTIKNHTDGCAYVCHAPGPDGRIIAMALDQALHSSTTIVWAKDTFTLGRGKYHNQYEPIWFGWVESGNKFTDRRDLANLWMIPRPKKSEEHPTMKPVELVERSIDHACPAGGTILDLFGGSGTTLIAAEKRNRKARLIELDPIYCDVIVKRWEDFTGKKAVLESKVTSD